MHAIEGSVNVPAFLTKLWRLVDDESTNDLISWTQVMVMQKLNNQTSHLTPTTSVFRFQEDIVDTILRNKLFVSVLSHIFRQNT